MQIQKKQQTNIFLYLFYVCLCIEMKEHTIQLNVDGKIEKIKRLITIERILSTVGNN